MASKPWTIVELNKAIALSSQGLTAQGIADQLGRPRAGVLSVMKLHGVELKRGRPKMDDPWAEHDERVARQAVAGSQRLLAAIQCAGVRP